MEGCPLKALRTGAGRNVSLPRWLALHLRTLFSKNLSVPEPEPRLPVCCVRQAALWLCHHGHQWRLAKFPQWPRALSFVLFKGKKKSKCPELLCFPSPRLAKHTGWVLRKGTSCCQTCGPWGGTSWKAGMPSSSSSISKTLIGYDGWDTVLRPGPTGSHSRTCPLPESPVSQDSQDAGLIQFSCLHPV